MDNQSMYLTGDKFLNIIKSTPLVSIDLVIHNSSNEILLGMRNNRPAKGFWFVPGGRILKDEPLATAIERISQAELGLTIPLNNARLLGAYDHFYPDNCLNHEGVTTHYVCLAHEINLTSDQLIQPDAQHSKLQWFSIDSILASPDVHENTKAYFK